MCADHGCAGLSALRCMAPLLLFMVANREGCPASHAWATEHASNRFVLALGPQQNTNDTHIRTGICSAWVQAGRAAQLLMSRLLSMQGTAMCWLWVRRESTMTLMSAQAVALHLICMGAGREAAADALPSSSTSTEEQQQRQSSAPAPAPSTSGVDAGQGLRLAGLGLAFLGLAAGVYFAGRRLLASSLGDKGKQARAP